MDIQQLNQQVIEEFRANDGKVGGAFEGGNLLLLHTVGAKSGQPRLNPLAYLPDGDRVVIIASFAGAPNHPPWYHNLVANPDVTVELGTETVDMRATIADEPERTALYARMAARMPVFNDYQAKTERVIPVIVLTRR